MTDVQFLPWMRTGLASLISSTDTTSGTPTITPAVDVLADGDVHPVTGPTVRLRGPGDVIGLNTSEIKRRDPQDGAVGAETNYFCSVEFVSPDLPWRYSPEPPSSDQISPWIALVVVELTEGVELTRRGSRLPVLTVEDAEDHLPDLDDSWAWAHVQVAHPLDAGVEKAYATDPKAFSSRLLCPRRLRADTTYTACLVPTFEAGREAGLDRHGNTSLAHAWSTGKAELPVYDSWELSAGDRFDFKTLAKRIDPLELPPEVGFRDLDLTDVATGIRPIERPATFAGAMHAPVERVVYWHDDDDRAQFENDIRRRLETTPSVPIDDSAYDPLAHDPVVAPPAHGAPQIGTNDVPDSGTGPGPGRPRRAKRGWFEELNIAPHHRAVAGLGAEVIRADQEALMAAAWEQAHEAIGVNRALNRARLVEESAHALDQKWSELDDAVAVSIATPSFVQMRTADTTVKRVIETGDAPSAYFSAAFRRLGREGGPLATAADAPGAQAPAVTITRAAIRSGRGDDGLVDPLSTAFRARYLPPGMDVGASLDSSAGGVFDFDLLDVEPDPLGDLGGFHGLDRAARVRLRQRASAVPAVGPEAVRRYQGQVEDRSSATLDLDPDIGQFVVEDAHLGLEQFVYDVVRPADLGRVLVTSSDTGQLGLDLAATVRAETHASSAVVDAVKARVVVPAAAWEPGPIPTRVELQPRFTDPMYERVRNLSVDYLVPGVGAVPNNVFGLLEINPAYIEAFLVGLNHEMSRELRWREYPAALGQTWFQYFFEHTDPDRGPDVDPIDEWTPTAPLGHEYAPSGTPGLIALIKADLIRKYPDVRVYAVPAMEANGVRTPNLDAEPTPPTFVGTLGRNVNFYGFETLTEENARDENGLGWFFVLEEEQRAMRFGLDGLRSGRKGGEPKRWDNLSWRHLAEEGGDVPWFCSITPPNTDLIGYDIGGLAWGGEASAMAAITYRRPIQVFMHATSMLPGGEG